MDNYLDQLNPSQRKAVEYIDGASLVIAGAGSGKTRVLTYKIAHLIECGYLPWQIMALTFTNKAANEMKERIASLVGDSARSLQMGTFHSVFARILRSEAKHIGYDSNFTIYDEADSRSLCKMIIKQLELDDKLYKPADVHSRISDAKNKLISPADYNNNPTCIARDQEQRTPEIGHIYELYVKNCRKSNAMDFDDLLVNIYELFRKHEDIRQKYAERYKYVLVDEYQDTNHVQQQIVWQITKDHKHICVVGDDAQSIYGFRGANIDNILDFQQLYEDSKLFKLEQNYRSTQRIVLAANSLIRHNNRQIPKDVYSRNEVGDSLIVRLLTSDKEEAISVCREIKSMTRHGKAQWSDFAILYRTNYQSRTFEEQMLKDNIPYRIYGGMSFYQRKEIKDIIAYFRLVVNNHDEEAFRRIINYPTRGLGQTTIAKLTAAAQAFGVSMWTVCDNPSSYNISITKGTAAKIAEFRSMIIGFSQRLLTEDAYELGVDIIKQSGISADIYSGHNADDTSRQENLEEFVSSLQEFVETNREEGLPVGLVDFLQDVSLMSDKESDGEDDINKVTLMTIHSAKGLEFPMVYVVGMEENIFPSPMSTGSLRQLEEERRLLYVAITRAERRCVLTCAKCRFRYGKMEFDAPSRFLKDIDPQYLKVENNTSADDYVPRKNFQPRESRFGNVQQSAQSKPKSVLKPITSAPTPSASAATPSTSAVAPSASEVAHSASASSQSVSLPGGLRIGSVVEHSRFGIGEVKHLEGTGDNAKATVEFRNLGTKQLLLKFAKLGVIG